MPALIYYSQRAMDKSDPLYAKLADADQNECQLGITCHRVWQNPHIPSNRFEQNAGIGVVLVGDRDEPTWAPVVVITNPQEPQAEPLLACEDCAGWLEEALGFKVQDADEV